VQTRGEVETKLGPDCGRSVPTTCHFSQRSLTLRTRRPCELINRLDVLVTSLGSNVNVNSVQWVSCCDLAHISPHHSHYARLFADKSSELFIRTGRRSNEGVLGLLLENASPRGKGDLFTLAILSRSKYDFSPLLRYSDTLIGGGRNVLLARVSAVLYRYVAPSTVAVPSRYCAALAGSLSS
jgi:acyl-CoA synthetase (AMP-forming)/AMP-acid ligase II